MTASDGGRVGRWLLCFFLVNSFAETMQAVAILWASYALTHNTALVGAVNAAAYLPGVVLGLVLRRRADAGDAARRLSTTNWVLLTGSLGLSLVWASGATHALVLSGFVAVQCSLSVVKTWNKAYVGRFVRERFTPKEAVRLLERATSVGLVGGLAGGASSGVLLDMDGAGWCFAVAAVLYLGSLLAVWRVAAVPRLPSAERPAKAAPGRGRAPRDPAAVRSAGLLRTVLFFSVPSSGALPFISTLMVPLAAAVAPGSSTFYSVLTVLVMCGGFLAGMGLSSDRVPMRSTLGLALAAGSLLSAAFAVTRWAPAVMLLMLLVAVVLTSHVIAMQVLTNQAPPPGEVGRFTVLRNSVAGSAKAGFSLLSGWLVEQGGLGTAWSALAAVLAVFAAAWWAMNSRRVAVERLVGVH